MNNKIVEPLVLHLAMGRGVVSSKNLAVLDQLALWLASSVALKLLVEESGVTVLDQRRTVLSGRRP